MFANKTQSKMTSRKSNKSVSKNVEGVTWTTEDLELFYNLKEIVGDQKPEDKLQTTTGECEGGVRVRPGVIRHTSYPDNPLAYYYMR